MPSRGSKREKGNLAMARFRARKKAKAQAQPQLTEPPSSSQNAPSMSMPLTNPIPHDSTCLLTSISDQDSTFSLPIPLSEPTLGDFTQPEPMYTISPLAHPILLQTNALSVQNPGDLTYSAHSPHTPPPDANHSTPPFISIYSPSSSHPGLPFPPISSTHTSFVHTAADFDNESELSTLPPSPTFSPLPETSLSFHQPASPALRRTDFVTGVLGHEVSPLAPTVDWTHGSKTIVPFIPVTPGSTQNAIPMVFILTSFSKHLFN